MRRVVVIGAGHNGLVCACILAKAGYQVTVFERTASIGGAGRNEARPCGCTINPGAVHFGMFREFLSDALGLFQEGLAVWRPHPQMVVGYDVGQSVLLSTDPATTRKEIAKISLADARQVHRYTRDLERAAQVVEPLLLSNTATIRDCELALSGADRGFPELFLYGSIEGTLGHYFKNDIVQGAFGATTILFNTHPSLRGSSFCLLYLSLMSAGGTSGWGVPIGGMGQVAACLATTLKKYGGKIVCNCGARRIIVKGGNAVGLQLEDGNAYRADVVVSSADPFTTYVSLVGTDPDTSVDLMRWVAPHFGGGALKLNLLLEQLPRPDALRADHESAFQQSLYVYCPSLEFLRTAHAESRVKGWARDPYVEMVLPSCLDRTQSCSRHITASVFGLFASEPHFRDLTVSARREEHNEIMSVFLRRCGIDKRSIAWSELLDPRGLYEKFGFYRGNLDHGSQTLDNIFEMRRIERRMGVNRLFLAGAGAHPGGLVSGMPGYNAALAVETFFGNLQEAES